MITLSERLTTTAEIEKAGGHAYLVALNENTPSAANIAAYADIVRERAVLRQLIHAGTEIANGAFNTEGRSSDELLDARRNAWSSRLPTISSADAAAT